MCLKTIGKMFTGTVDVPSPADYVFNTKSQKMACQTRPNHHQITTQSLPKITWKPLCLFSDYAILNAREIFSTIVITRKS